MNLLKETEEGEKSMIYLDNAATTKMSDEVKKAMMPYFDEIYGNPSSLHIMGQVAKESLDLARRDIADCINAGTNEIYFTSGGSESDNWAITNAANFGQKKGKKHIITTAFEHHAVLNSLNELERKGFDVTYLPVYDNGIVKVDDIKKALRDDTCLVTVMFANNEIGTIQPIREIGALCRSKGIPFHTDAVQAVGHVPIDVVDMNIDMLSCSAHKFHGPKGIGFLYVRKSMKLNAMINGGAQERNKRAGTENLPSIIGMSIALKSAVSEMESVSQKEIKLRNKLFEQLSKIPHSKINGDLKNRLPNNFNMSFEGLEGESLLLLLSDKGICASSGSACTSGSLEPSHMLLAIGLPHEVAHGSLRLTLSRYTTKEEIEKTIMVVPEVVNYLRSISPVWDKLKKGEINYVIQ